LAYLYEGQQQRSAIMRADQLKQQFPNMQVRVVDDNGRLIYQA
jgi:hypothetical protein